jgi:hypothetical protein
VLQGNASRFLSKTQLIKLKLKAIRAGVWFKALPRIDRVLVDLTIKVASHIRSVTLAKNILAVTKKLEALLESKLRRAITEIGFPIACKLSLLAQKWGNEGAKEWTKDVNFVRYLAVMGLNGKPISTRRGRTLV